MYTINKIQHKVLESTKHITLIANGRCQGATEAMVLKSLMKIGNSLFIVPCQRDVLYVLDMFEKVCTTLEEPFMMEYDGTGKVVRMNTAKINIQTAKEAERRLLLKVNSQRVYVDRPELMPKTIDLLLAQKQRFNQITFATNPIECGWRDPLFCKGLPDFDKKGNMITNNRSWDYNLIDWKPFKHNTRAEIEDYKSFVEVINIPTQENYLVDGYQPYNEEQTLYLTGDWITGVEIKI